MRNSVLPKEEVKKRKAAYNKEYNKQWRAKNKVHKREYKTAHRSKNVERYNELNREYKQKKKIKALKRYLSKLRYENRNKGRHKIYYDSHSAEICNQKRLRNKETKDTRRKSLVDSLDLSNFRQL